MSTLNTASATLLSSLSAAPKGYFGPYGGQYVPDSALPVLARLEEAFTRYVTDPAFTAELDELLVNYVGRKTPLFHCRNLSDRLGGAQIYLKREDLNHLGAHKLNNALGQALLAKRMGARRVIAETGAGQHGVATAAAAALLGMECTVYMGEEDIRRQHLNVLRMKMMGSEVVCVTDGQRTLKEAVDKAVQVWLESEGEIFYVLGSAVGPHPYPTMVRHFQHVIGKESRAQMLAQAGRLPDYVLACVGGGSNAIGMFSGFISDESVKLVGIEPGGKGLKPGEHAATLTMGTPGILHGYKSYILQDDKGETLPVYSISAGLDYPGVGPEHALLSDTGRAEYTTIDDNEAVDALFVLSREEGIIPALESAHALAHALKIAPGLSRDQIILVCLSGRGDKDMEQIAEMMDEK